MAAWQDFTTHLPMHWQAIRYEDLITAFEPEVRKLLAFLRLDWSDAVLGHTAHARTRGIINTPSYHQVTVPIYQHARYRWKRYERDSGSVIGVLTPYIERLGYSATDADARRMQRVGRSHRRRRSAIFAIGYMPQGESHSAGAGRFVAGRRDGRNNTINAPSPPSTSRA